MARLENEITVVSDPAKVKKGEAVALEVRASRGSPLAAALGKEAETLTQDITKDGKFKWTVECGRLDDETSTTPRWFVEDCAGQISVLVEVAFGTDTLAATGGVTVEGTAATARAGRPRRAFGPGAPAAPAGPAAPLIGGPAAPAPPGGAAVAGGGAGGGGLPAWFVGGPANFGSFKVALQRASTPSSGDQILWMLIRNRARAISFEEYDRYITRVMCPDDVPYAGRGPATLPQTLRYTGLDAYRILRLATECFLMQECGVFSVQPRFGAPNLRRRKLSPPQTTDAADEETRVGRALTAADIRQMRIDYWEVLHKDGATVNVLPYFKEILEPLKDIPLKPPAAVPENCYGILQSKITGPLALELIWSYWHEEGMLVQTMKAISRRFQNRRSASVRDPLANLEIDPLRPLNNLVWGYIQDEQNRLTVLRRAYEYDHHYGITLFGKAVPAIEPADSRTRFVEAFHELLHRCTNFFKESDDTTVVADGFPVLNALKETHLILAEGAHNQFGDLPWTARVEMLIEQWLLARPEMRQFLGGRVMVPYAEPWMDRVDTMKKLQGWSDTTVTHFRDLGVFGEQLLLSIRYGNWSQLIQPAAAAGWANYWRPEIQGYIHGYRAVTGVDLTADVTEVQPATRYAQPAVHLRERLAAQRLGTGAQPALGSGPAAIPQFRSRRALRRAQ